MRDDKNTQLTIKHACLVHALATNEVEMLTVTQLATAYNTSRPPILYYERARLLLPNCRSDNGYRWYGKKEQARIESIIS